ncbi:MAG: hypothetical protein ACXW2R_06940 [Candidatus Aminicenantales bacterium]
MKKWLIVCLVFVGLAAGYGCKGTTEPVVKHPPTITSFTAAPTTIHTGEASVLTWNVTGATTLSINQGVGTVTGATGTRSVSPTATTTYTLTATNADGTRTATATVTISLVTPTIDSFTATPASIKLNESSTLSWAVTDATTVSIDQSIGTVAATGTQAVTPLVTTTYTLTATNADGTTTGTAEVTILPAAVITIATSPAPPVFIYDTGANTTTSTFSEIFTETNGVAGHVYSAYTGFYLTPDPASRIASHNFGNGDFAANGSLTLGPETESGTGQAMIYAILCTATDVNGYLSETAFYGDISWAGATGTAQLKMVVPGLTDPRIVRLVEDLKTRKK